MTVRELREALKDKPDTMDVVICQVNDEYRFSLLEAVELKEVDFVDGEVRAPAQVVILTDEL
jgi:hypothetical protein